MEEQILKQEVVERLVRIETKLDNYESVRDKADKAYARALHNEELINDIKVTNRWAWGFMITLAISFVGFLLSQK
ncbi:MAG: hemolysin XhlA family protein [Lactococcus petauri]|uniref:hemolysin XhlA family protein n=1 Tax=Lactococcus petauri TaxID=1940789 RepID=UPI0018A9EEB2|nr:hemolysin XhlA family protein [Lactococcus petauri]MDC0826984.1 hemolysin XhlA family protein [Lactococcus petauri]